MRSASWKTSLVVCVCSLALLFGDFSLGMVLAFFGGIDLLVDPYSNAGTAQIALHVNKFYDVDVRQAGALAYTKDFA